MLGLTLLCSAFITSIIPGSLWASQIISLQTLLTRSAENHPDDILLRARQNGIEGMKTGEVSLPNPMVSYEEMTSSGMSSMKETKWELTQKIPFPIKTYFTWQLYNRELEAVAEELLQNQKLREANLTVEYFRWLSLVKKIKLKKEQESLLSQLIAVQRTRYVAQKVTQVELVALQIERGNLLNELTELEAKLSQQIAQVETLAGPGDSLNNLEPKDEKLVFNSFSQEPIATIEKKLDEQNHELRSLKIMSQKEESAVAKAQGSWIPDLEIMLNQRKDDFGTKKQAWQVGIEIPLWFGGEQRSQIQLAKANSLVSSTKYQETKRKMVLDFNTVMSEQAAIKKQLELMENGLVQWSSQNVQSARIAYQTGKLEYASFLALMQSAYQTLANYEDLKVKALENQSKIQVLLGGQS